MKNQATFTLLAIVFQLVYSQASFAGPWPALETDKQKLEYGLALREKIPNFFTGTFNYGMDWWSITENQATVKKAIKALYPASFDTAPLAVITLNKAGEKQIPSHNQFEQFKQSLLAQIANSPAGTTKESLAHELISGIETLQKIRPGELLNQLLHSVPNDLRDKAIMKEPIEVKLAYLEKNLPDDLHQTQFYGQAQQNAIVQSKAHGIKLVRDLFAFDKELPNLVAILAASSELEAKANKESIQKIVSHLTEAQFVQLQDTSVTEELLTKSLSGKSEVAKQAVNTFGKAMQKLATVESRTVAIDVPYLELAQKPRDIAIVRSATASDCTHTCSYAKADSPSSRVFYVIDAKTKKELGYIESEIRASEVGDVLYVYTINGQTITPAQAEEMLFMLDSQKEKLGVKKVAVAAEHLQYFMNYQEVIDFMENHNHGKPRIHVEAKNKKIAEAIDHAVEADYQKEYRNHEAVLHDPDMQKFAGVKTHFSTVENKEVLSRPIKKNEAMLFALELDSAQREYHGPEQLTDGERAIVAAQLDLNKYRELHATLQNRNHLPYQEYMAVAKKALKEYGYDATPEWVNKFPHIFYDGQLASSDAAEGQLRKSSFILIAQLLKRGLWHSTWGVQEFAKDPQKLAAFNESKELNNVLRWASSDVNFHSIQLRNMALAGIGHNQLKEYGIERELVRLVEHGWSWGQDTSNEILRAAKVDVTAYLNDENPEVRQGAKKFLRLNPPQKDRAKAANDHGSCAKIFSISH